MRVPWWLGHLAVVALGITLWDVLLFKRYLDRPIVVLSLVTLGLATCWALAWIARSGSLPDSYRSVRIWARADRVAAILLLLFATCFLAQHWGHQRAVADGRAYFLQVRSVLVDGDLDFTEDAASFGTAGSVGQFAFGTAILWMPFFEAADLWIAARNVVAEPYPRDGFGNPYQRAVGLGTLVYAFLGFILLYRMLAARFSRATSLGALLATVLGTFLLWYVTIDATYSHGASFFAVTAFIYVWDRTRGDQSMRRWLALGALAGLMTLVRWQNVGFVLFAAWDVVTEVVPAIRTRRTDRLRTTLLHGAAFAAAAALVFSPQLLFWKVVRGGWLALPTGDHALTWAGSRWADAMFFSDRGLVTWTPIVLFALIGLAMRLKVEPAFAALLLATLGVQIYINGTVWWGGYGFGARRFANSATAFAVGIAVFLVWLRKHPRVAPAALVMGAVVLNVALLFDQRATPQAAGGSDRLVSSLTRRMGDPLSLPMNFFYAWRYRADLGLYGRMAAWRPYGYSNFRLDLGAPDDELFLLDGWDAPEANNERNARWAVGPRARLLVPLREQADYELVLTGRPFHHPTLPAQRVHVVVNGESLGYLDPIAGFAETRLRLRPGALHPGINELVLEFSRTASPQSLGLSDDARELAMMFDRIELMQISGDPTQ